MAVLMPEGRQSFTDSAGAPLVGGKLYTYAAGTSTPQATYTDAAQVGSNTNPIILNGRGEATVFWSGAYKVTLTDSADVVIWTQDNVSSSDLLPNSLVDGLRSQLANTSTPSLGDAMLGVRESVTGSVARTQDSKNNDSVSIRTFGAVLDGVTDDSLAYSKALLNGGRVTVPVGTARLASKVSIPTSCTTIFVGEAGIPLNKSRILVDFDGPAFEMAGGTTSFVGFENIFFTATASYANSQAFKGIGDGVHCHFERCTFDNFKGIAVEMATAFVALFKNCLFQFCFKQPIKVSAGTGVKLQQCTFESNYAGGPDLFGSGFVVDTCYWENNCKDNNPAGANLSWRELKLAGAQHTVIGGSFALWPTNNKFPIELAAARATTFIGVRGFSLGAAPHWVNINATDASAIAIDCPDFTYAGVTQNLMVQDAGYVAQKPDIAIAGQSFRNSSARVWAVINGTTGALKSGQNAITSTRTGVGVYRITWTAGTFASLNYGVLPAAQCAAAVTACRYTNKIDGQVDIQVNNTATTALVDADEVTVYLFGI